jgi:hypothetical protein
LRVPFFALFYTPPPKFSSEFYREYAPDPPSPLIRYVNPYRSFWGVKFKRDLFIGFLHWFRLLGLHRASGPHPHHSSPASLKCSSAHQDRYHKPGIFQLVNNMSMMRSSSVILCHATLSPILHRRLDTHTIIDPTVNSVARERERRPGPQTPIYLNIASSLLIQVSLADSSRRRPKSRRL